jgi:hypothetical protein
MERVHRRHMKNFDPDPDIASEEILSSACRQHWGVGAGHAREKELHSICIKKSEADPIFS